MRNVLLLSLGGEGLLIKFQHPLWASLTSSAQMRAPQQMHALRLPLQSSAALQPVPVCKTRVGDSKTKFEVQHLIFEGCFEVKMILENILKVPATIPGPF